MNIKPVNDVISVSAQITAADVATIKKQGFKSIICNRPDNEQADQINFAEIEQAAIDAEINCYFLPVITGNITKQDVEKFADLVNQISTPILAYCRTGNRSITLWALVNKGKLEHTQLIKIIEAAGYDVKHFLDALHATS
ncbi:TIGR01244 family sulfur transferase [Neptunicella marina]|uniref:TIGR01244 family phosphatase n=1 Tax=Neptunicella marina TaxID=2125989 RepID=A0A8J6J135_9ALTE|nr:TIGR01244 family sulfur transferase [Neptunicella marina]MBC3767748.1 TIGR01244 family phosphatase [Neptunicella marina]